MVNTLLADKKSKWVGLALIFLALGMISSPTIASLYIITVLVPAILIYISRSYRIKISKSSWALIALTIWGIISGLYNLDTLHHARKSFDDLKFYFMGVFLIIPLRYYFERANPYKIKRLLNIFFFVIIAAFIVGIIKAKFKFNLVTMSFGDFNTRSGGFTNYMRYGYSHSFIFLFLTSLYIFRKKWRNIITPKLFYPALLSSFLAIVVAETRGALLTLIIGFPFLLFKFRPKLFKYVLVAGGVFLFIVGIFSFNKINTGSRFFNINDGSNYIRMSQFLTATKAISENPVMGLGPDQFSYNVTQLKEKYDIWAKHYTGHAHNIFLEHAADFGIPGFIFILCFFVFWFFEMKNLNSSFSWIIMAYIVSFVASGQVENLFDNTNSHLLFFIYSISQILYLYQGEEKLSEILS